MFGRLPRSDGSQHTTHCMLGYKHHTDYTVTFVLVYTSIDASSLVEWSRDDWRPALFKVFEHWDFGFVSDFVIRISNLTSCLGVKTAKTL